MTDFDPSLTQRLIHKAKKKVAPDWRSRWKDLSTQIAKVGALVQGTLVMLPPDAVSKDVVAYVAASFFILIGGAKLVTEPWRVDTGDAP